MWLPGIKCRKGDSQVDFDIIALCDGHLIAAECKTLRDCQSNSGCESIIEQLCHGVQNAKSAGADLFIIASQIQEYPAPVKQSVISQRNDSIALGHGKRSFVWIPPEGG